MVVEILEKHNLYLLEGSRVDSMEHHRMAKGVWAEYPEKFETISEGKGQSVPFLTY